MDILTALQISLFGFLVVFTALALISFSIKILSKIIAFFERPKNQEDKVIENISPVTVPNNVEMDNSIGHGELKLYGVDEKTAAMIMAIVSDDSKIPLEELQFKSIKLLEN